jgi:hypothetical protein
VADSDSALNIENTILREVLALRAEISSFAASIRERVAILETDNHDVMGNGQPGRMAKAEGKIETLQAWRWKLLGASAAASGLFSGIAWIIAKLIK